MISHQFAEGITKSGKYPETQAWKIAEELDLILVWSEYPGVVRFHGLVNDDKHCVVGERIIKFYLPEAGQTLTYLQERRVGGTFLTVAADCSTGRFIVAESKEYQSIGVVLNKRSLKI